MQEHERLCRALIENEKWDLALPEWGEYEFLEMLEHVEKTYSSPDLKNHLRHALLSCAVLLYTVR